MDFKIKLCGFLYTIVLTIEIIHGRDVPNVKKALGINKNGRETQKQMKLSPPSQHHLRHWTLRPWDKLIVSQEPQQQLKFDSQSQTMSTVTQQKFKLDAQFQNLPTVTQQKFKLDAQFPNLPTVTQQKFKLDAQFPNLPTVTQQKFKLDAQSQNMSTVKQLQFKFGPPPRIYPHDWGMDMYHKHGSPHYVAPLKFDPKQVPLFPPPSYPHKISQFNTNQAVQAGLPSPRMYKFESAAPSQADSLYAITFTAEWSYGIVPYYIDEETNDENLKRRIQKAMSLIEASSCVIFKEKTEKPKDGENASWLHFSNPNQQRECSHDTKEGDNNDIIIVLGIECLKLRDILHSVLHGLGFKDEVSHPHRDKYIKILWENIQPKYRPLFRVRRDKATHKLVEYDPMSIMHFHDRDFSENGGLTIAPVMPGLVIEPSDNLSQLDVMQLRIKFGHECNKRKVGNLIDNCKNVLYHAEGNGGQDDHVVGNDGQDDNAAGNDDQDDNAAGNDDQDDNAAGNDDQDDNAAGNDDQDDNAAAIDDQDDNAAGNDDQDDNAAGNDDQDDNAAGNDDQDDNAKANDDHGDNAEPNDDQESNAAGNDDQKLDAETKDSKDLNSEGNKEQKSNATANKVQKLTAVISNDQELNAAGKKDKKLNTEASHDQELNSAGNNHEELNAEVRDYPAFNSAVLKNKRLKTSDDYSGQI